MSRVVRHTLQAVALLVGAPMAGLLAYDLIAVRPHVAEIEAILANADEQDASPPLLIRDLIDANAGSPVPSVVRMAVHRFYSTQSASKWHIRNVLWRILLPLHFNDDEMYGLYASQAYNGVDNGLDRLAKREYDKSLDALSADEAARVVAIIRAPSFMLRDRRRLEARAEWLLARRARAR